MNEMKRLVIDADAHVIESDDTWDFLEPAEAKYRPKKLPDPLHPGRHYWEVDGRRGPPALTVEAPDDIEARAYSSNRRIGTPPEARMLKDIGKRLSHMDSLGIDVAVLHNTIFLYDMTEDPEAEAALTRAWNRWLGNTWKSSNGRLNWSCLIPTRMLDEAKVQMRWAKENGAVAVCMRPLEGDRMVTDPYFYPVMEEAQRLDLSMAIHIANGCADNARLYGTQPGPGGHPAAGFGIFRVPTVAASMYVLLGETSELFPKLRWGFIEASSQWVPWVHREAERRLEAAGKPLPDDLFAAKNVYVTCQVDEDLPWILKYAGEKSLVIGTDYGHNDPSANMDVIGLVRSRTDISEMAKENILTNNPARLFALQPALQAA